MTTVTGISIVIASLNLAGSLSSFIGSGLIIVTYIILPKRRHFRHVLILNLATSDCLNALNQSIPGLYILITRKSLSSGPLCVTNGFMGQFTVQATDCAILVIALITVFNVTRFQRQSAIWNRSKIVLVTFGIWILPAITATIALGLNLYGPASGSWCWLVENPKYLRYVLTHGWRFLFIFIEIALYTYLHFFLKKHYNNLSKVMGSRNGSLSTSQRSIKENTSMKQGSDSSLQRLASDHEVIVPSGTVKSEPPARNWFYVWSHRTEEYNPTHRSIQRILLLNAYPLAYIILWIPGIANRMVEVSGHTSHVTQILQASTQFVGLANALTFGWNESIAKQLFRKLDVDKDDDM